MNIKTEFPHLSRESKRLLFTPDSPHHSPEAFRNCWTLQPLAEVFRPARVKTTLHAYFVTTPQRLFMMTKLVIIKKQFTGLDEYVYF